MTSAKSFVYKMQAVYEGQGDIRKLQTDLKSLQQIEAFTGLEKSFVETNKKLVEAKAKVRELRQEMKQPGGEAFAASYEKAKGEVEKLVSSLQKQKASLDSARNSLKVQGVDVTDLAGKYKQLQAETNRAGNIIAAQAKLGVRSVAEVEREVDGLRRAYKELAASGSLSMGELSAAKSAMNSKISEIRQNTGNWRNSLDTVHRGWLGILGVVTTVAATMRGIKFTADFDDSMRSVAAVSGATGDEFERLKTLAKDLGATTRFTAAEAAAGMEELAQSGMNVEEIFRTLPQALNVAAISGGTIKEAADLITDTLKQFSLQVEDSGKVADVLTKGYTSSSTSLMQLGQALSYVGPIANSLGYDLEETVAVLEALAEAGFKGERAGTALRGGMARLINPSNDAAAVLKKYNIAIYDTEGNVRKFADILADLGNATLKPQEQFELFGQEAGPGMAGLLSQGADAVRSFEKDLRNAGGTAAKIAGDKEGGIGGALRELNSSMQAVVLSFGDSVAPAVMALAKLLTGLARTIESLPEPVRQTVAVFATMVTATAAWKLGLGAIVGVIGQSVVAVGTLVANLSGLRLAMLAIPGWAGLAAGIAVDISMLIKLISLYREHRQAIAATNAANEHNATLQEKLAAKYREISAATGVTITSAKELKAAVADGLIHFDQAAKRWVAGQQQMAAASRQTAQVQQQVTGEALQRMQLQYEAYVDRIISLQGDIERREMTLYERMRDFAREGMSGVDAWQDMKRQAEEYAIVARAAFEAGDGNTAVKYADLAVRYYEKLNTVVEENGRVMVSAEQAREASAKGVQQNSKLAIDALKMQQKQADEAMDALTEASGWQNLAKNMDEAKQQWLDNWSKMKARALRDIDEVGRKLDEITKDRETNIYVNTIQQKAMGGLPLQFAAGGTPAYFRRLSSPYINRGSGLRDDVPALLKRREYVQPDWATNFWGLGFMESVRRLDAKGVMASLLKRLGNPTINLPSLPVTSGVRMLATGGLAGGSTGDNINITLNYSGSASRADVSAMTDMLLTELERRKKGRS